MAHIPIHSSDVIENIGFTEIWPGRLESFDEDITAVSVEELDSIAVRFGEALALSSEIRSPLQQFSCDRFLERAFHCRRMWAMFGAVCDEQKAFCYEFFSRSEREDARDAEIERLHMSGLPSDNLIGIGSQHKTNLVSQIVCSLESEGKRAQFVDSAIVRGMVVEQVAGAPDLWRFSIRP